MGNGSGGATRRAARVPRLPWTLHRARYTGALTLERGRVETRLWWRDGDATFVRHPQVDAR